jgi:ATP-dependent 26S proteasome regulatory subunit
MSGHFIVSSKKKLSELEEGARIEQSDFATMSPDGVFTQLKYVEEDDTAKDKMDVHPGIFHIVKTMQGFRLETTNFNQDKILEDFVFTKNIEDTIDCFFKNIHVYYEEGFDVAKRAMLLYGPPGTGKSTVIAKVCNKYVADQKTLVLIWNTDKYEAHEVKGLVQSFNYLGVDKMILIAEDIGGMERDEVRRGSESSLLSLLDNQEKTFNIPIFIIATTNFPETLMGNLTNRPQRFDDKIEVGYPNGEMRKSLLQFYMKGGASEEELSEIAHKKCDSLTPSHIREIRIRSRIYNKTALQVIKDIVKEIELYNKAFQKNKSNVGFMHD